MSQIDFYQMGQEAYAAGQPRVPVLNSVVIDAVKDLPLGGGATKIFREVSRGWDAANLADDSWDI